MALQTDIKNDCSQQYDKDDYLEGVYSVSAGTS